MQNLMISCMILLAVSAVCAANDCQLLPNKTDLIAAIDYFLKIWLKPSYEEFTNTITGVTKNNVSIRQEPDPPLFPVFMNTTGSSCSRVRNQKV